MPAPVFLVRSSTPLAAGLLWALLSLSVAANETTKDPRAFIDLVGSLSDGETLTIPPGTYRLCDTESSGINISGIEDAVMAAEGVTVVLKSPQGLRFEDCKNVRVTGLTVDYDPFPFSQGTIKRIDASKEELAVELDEGFPTPDTLPQRDSLLYFVFDPETLVPRPLLWEGFGEFSPLPDGLWRFARPTAGTFFGELARAVAPKEGDKIAFFNRGGPVFDLQDCAALHFEDVTVHAAPGYAFFEERGDGGHRYTRCRIVRPEGSKRLLTTGADGFHSYLVRRGPTIEDCEFNDTADDTIAVHGFFSFVTGGEDPATVQMVSPFGADFDVGETLRFYLMPHGKPVGEAKVVSVRVAEPSEVKTPPDQLLAAWAKEGLRTRKKNPDMKVRVVGLDSPVEFPADAMLLVSCRGLAGNGTLVKNTVIRRSHKRGILVKADDVTIEGNTLEEVAGPSILIEPELFWLEGPLPRGVTIRDNTIIRSSWRSMNEEGSKFGLGGAIDIGTLFGRRAFPPQQDPYPLMEDFTIEGNTISDSGAYAIVLGNVRGARVEGNTINGVFRRPGAAASRGLSRAFDATEHDAGAAADPAAPPGAVIVHGCEDVKFSGNAITTGGEIKGLVVGPWCRDVKEVGE